MQKGVFWAYLHVKNFNFFNFDLNYIKNLEIVNQVCGIRFQEELGKNILYK